MLDKSSDAEAYSQQAREIAAAFNARFFNQDKGTYATGSQAANAIPFVMGITEKPHGHGVLEAIVRDVQDRGNALTAGDVGYRYLLRALAQGGRSDVVFAMNHQSEKPGYGYQLKQGATSLTEAWDAGRGSSHNHFMLGQIMEWFYHDLAGIQPDPATPGFKHIVIRPAPVGDLTWVKASYDSVHGMIRTHWMRREGKFTLRVTIPANTSATVHLPGKFSKASPASLVKRMPAREGSGATSFTVGSGDYEFESELQR